MAGIGLGSGGNFATHGVEIPNEVRIAPPGNRRGDFFNSVIAPQPSNTAKCGNPTFGADAGTGEDKNTIDGGEV